MENETSLTVTDATTNQQIHINQITIAEAEKQMKRLTIHNKKAAQRLQYALECLAKAYTYLSEAHAYENNILVDNTKEDNNG